VVVIEGTRIARIGLAVSAKVPQRAEVAPATGTWLIPGSTNMHVHLDLKLP
jgi:cytosine/adenosine deaminase-related metal-dependent hydrolase